MDINITDAAVAKVKDLLIEEKFPFKLRIAVQGGGCSGFQYSFQFEEKQTEDDFEFERDGVSVLVDSMSYQYLAGATVDFYDDEFESQFTIKNPNAQTTCGCGSSFSV